MAQNISRRKYARLVRYFTTIMTDPKESTKTRMAAAFRLDDLLARADARADRALERAQRRELAALNVCKATEAENAQKDAARVSRAGQRGELLEAEDADDFADDRRIAAVF